MSIKIGVIGAGNLGKVLATLLASSGYDVEIAVKRKAGVKINDSFLYEIRGDFGDKSCLIPTVQNIDKFTTKKDIIICAVRNYDLASTAKKALKHLENNGTIISIHNMFAVSDIMRIIPDEKSVCMFCNFACTEVNKHIYVSNSCGMTLGVYNRGAKGRLDIVAKIFSKYCSIQFAPDVFGLGISRTIINNAISAMGAITGDRLGKILENKRGRKIFCKLIEETVAVCRRYRIKICPYNDILDYCRFTENSISGKIYKFRILRLLRKQNGFIRSSALLDFERGKKPELLYLLENFLKYAVKSRVDIKYIRQVYNMLLDIYNGNIRIDENNLEKIID